MTTGDKNQKGIFGAAGLPVSGSYLYPASRNRALMIAVALALLAGLTLLADLAILQSPTLSNGPLSSGHAGLEKDCESCHSSFEPVVDEKCSACHDQFPGANGAHSFDAHYIYLSADETRAARRDNEVQCFGCHQEHLGRDAQLTAVENGRCLACHVSFSFGDGHPEFDFVAESRPDDSQLKFTHIRHVRSIMEKDGVTDPQATCSSCHQLDRNGRHFQPIQFANHCGRCHLGTSPQVRSANFQIREAGPILMDSGELNLGVETLETVRQRQDPGEQWALSASPAEFRIRGSRVMKTRLRHRDPWILHNLRDIRRVLYPEMGLAGLLDFTPNANTSARQLYEEAVGKLQEYADGLRSRSDQEMNRELEQADSVLAALRKELNGDVSSSADAPNFQTGERNPNLTEAQLGEIDEFVKGLTEQCQVCHEIEKASVLQVPEDQRILGRANFAHSTHMIQQGCLNCHTQIPFEQYLEESPAADAVFDQSTIQNVPAIESCRQCHNVDGSSDRCSTCHDFHPLKEVYSVLPR